MSQVLIIKWEFHSTQNITARTANNAKTIFEVQLMNMYLRNIDLFFSFNELHYI